MPIGAHFEGLERKLVFDLRVELVEVLSHVALRTCNRRSWFSLSMDPLDHVLTALIATDSAAVANLPVVLGALEGVSLRASAHLRKLVARLSTLMHSKEPSARWVGICIANHCFKQDRDAVLEHAHVWVATCLPILSVRRTKFCSLIVPAPDA